MPSALAPVARDLGPRSERAAAAEQLRTAVRSGAASALANIPDPTWIEAPAGYRIPVRRFGMHGKRPPLVLLHGLQSHSGWFVQSARRVAELGVPVHAFDRCGSGLSEADAELGSTLDGLLAEVDAVADQALLGTGHDSVHLLGHCFGAIVALLYAAQHRPARVASLVLATPALYTLTDLPPRDKARVLWNVLGHRPARVRVPLVLEQFSELEPFVQFVRNDPLVLQTVPARLLFEVSRARRRLPAAAAGLRAPLFVAFAGGDTICDNARTRRLLEQVTAPVEAIEYAGARHVLEFSRQRESFLNDLAGWFEGRE